MNQIETFLVKQKTLFFRLIALHSFLVGVGLILHPLEFMSMFGFRSIHEHFFPIQGGVFHILMATCYVWITFGKENSQDMIRFSLVVKITATVFLFSYYFFARPILAVVLSAVIDGIMAVLIYVIIRGCSKSRQEESNR